MTHTITTLYKFGFEYKGILYGLKNKKLYRLPHTKDKRSYSILEIKFYCFKSTLVANIQRNKLTINKLKSLTSIINLSIISTVDDGVLF